MVTISKEQIGSARKAGAAIGPTVNAARYRRASGKLELEYANGMTLSVPIALIQELQLAGDVRSADLAAIEIWGAGYDLYFPRLSVFVHTPSLLQGVFGTQAWMRELARGMGLATSRAKAAAARENGKKGGRPRKQPAVSTDQQPRRRLSTARAVVKPSGHVSTSIRRT
ncbi:DUF2442 domain-containing protein [Mycetohabitans endofungorum]|uniref:hypothetical protein n=1 Tax=Mycetohabitans endofungorum TaxID=417203 RepID=UPI002B06031E|nr:hypothetical protein [Mycetohabitans endofungorum]